VQRAAHARVRASHANLAQVNAFVYEYTGYGRSTGEPSEEALYADVEAAFDYMLRHLHIQPHKARART
jgi:hypothetical protein